MTRRSTVVGVFDNSDSARDAINALKDAGFDAGDIGILMKDRGETREMAEDTGTSAGEGAAAGAIGGGILGGLTGWLVGIGALAIPGVGPFIAAGAFGAALAGAGIGAGVGAIAGALVGMGIPKDEAEFYEGEVRQGRTLVTVKADGRYTEARDILTRHGAYDIENRHAGAGTGTTTGTGYGTSAMSTGTGTGRFDRWEDASPYYRNRFQSRYGKMGSSYTWQDYEPGYRYGFEMRNRPEYRGRKWTEVEPEFRRDWESRHRDKPWDRFMDSIRDVWEDRDTEYRGEHRTGVEDEETIRLREERLRVDKERVKTGEVGIHKEVVSERQEMDVPVTREDVYVERRKVNEPSDRPIGADDDETFRVPVYEEKVTTDKETVVSEEIDVGKRRVQDTEHVSDTVRREQAKIDKEGDYIIEGGLGGANHEHRWVNDRCEICGATRRHRRAA